jgi:hypothetical protein
LAFLLDGIEVSDKSPPYRPNEMKGFGMSKMGKYIYGIINSGLEKSFDLTEIAGLINESSVRSPIKTAKTSEISNRAYSVSFQDISAVVSDAELVDYNHIPKDTLARLLLKHQAVIEKIMAEHTIIPMRLGTFANNSEDVRHILTRGYKAIKDIFEKAENVIEIDVVATLADFNSFLRQVSEVEEIKQLRQSLLSKPEGVTTDDQMQIGVLVKEHLDREKEKYANQIKLALNEIAQDCKSHDLMDDKMVLNTAFLIDRREQNDFEQKVAVLNSRFENRLNFRCVGPLPPYSFYTLKVEKVQFDDVDWAKRKLGLTDDFITANDIKKAHHRLALTCHPDKQPDEPDIEAKFAEMTKAYKILLDYYRASDQTGQGDGCYFDEESFGKNAVLVTTTE